VADLRTLALFLGLCASAECASQAAFSVTADQDSVGIGEVLTLTLESDESITEGQQWTWPALAAGDSLAQGWEILSVGAIDSAASLALDAGIRRTQAVEILAWDTGFRVIEPLQLGGDNPVLSAPLLIQIGAHALEDNPAPRPMQGYTHFEWTWWERLMRILPPLLLVLGLAAAAWWVLKQLRNRESVIPPPLVPQEPAKPAHLTALRMLEALEVDQPWKDGEGKEAQAQLSEAVRLHLQGTFGVKALERATEELTAHLTGAPIRGLDGDDARWLVSLLRQSDLVKFAKQDLSSDAHLHAVREALAWVRRTSPAADPTEPNSDLND